MINVVLDSNIFVSGFLFNGKQRKVLDYAIEGKFKVFISEEILSEIKDVLKRPKFKLPPKYIKMIISEIESLSEICYTSEKVINICRDSNDHIILECALESKSDYIITGDEDLLSLNAYKGIKILNSDSFLKYIDDLTGSR
jgi:putative PIN family toxin of toxin-antitoxin system